MSKRELIIIHGKNVLESESFSTAKDQVHHLKSNVASHSINTALICITIYRCTKYFNVTLNLPLLITAALAHDLGMIGRSHKYSSKMESYKQHPEESAQTLKRIVPDVDHRICDAIETHMYPVNAKRPASREAWALCIADKLAACTDWFTHKNISGF